LASPPYNPGVRDLVEVKRAWARTLSEDDIERGFLGWHENGYLPHREEPGLVQFVTFRLADAFPPKFWQDGYWDTYMRGNEHESRTRRYIENNPVKAGLVRTTTEWPWSSARFRDPYERLTLSTK